MSPEDTGPDDIYLDPEDALPNHVIVGAGLDSISLSREQVAWLIPRLAEWLETPEAPPPPFTAEDL